MYSRVLLWSKKRKQPFDVGSHRDALLVSAVHQPPGLGDNTSLAQPKKQKPIAIPQEDKDDISHSRPLQRWFRAHFARLHFLPNRSQRVTRACGLSGRTYRRVLGYPAFTKRQVSQDDLFWIGHPQTVALVDLLADSHPVIGLLPCHLSYCTGHTLVVPRSHVPKLSDLSPSESASLAASLVRVARAVEKGERSVQPGRQLTKRSPLFIPKFAGAVFHVFTPVFVSSFSSFFFVRNSNSWWNPLSSRRSVPLILSQRSETKGYK